MAYLSFILFILLNLVSVVSSHTKDEWQSRTIYQVLTDNMLGLTQTHAISVIIVVELSVVLLINSTTLLGWALMRYVLLVENTPGGYHGYWAQNIGAINHQFGSPEDLGPCRGGSQERCLGYGRCCG